MKTIYRIKSYLVVITLFLVNIFLILGLIIGYRYWTIYKAVTDLFLGY